MREKARRDLEEQRRAGKRRALARAYYAMRKRYAPPSNPYWRDGGYVPASSRTPHPSRHAFDLKRLLDALNVSETDLAKILYNTARVPMARENRLRALAAGAKLWRPLDVDHLRWVLGVSSTAPWRKNHHRQGFAVKDDDKVAMYRPPSPRVVNGSLFVYDLTDREVMRNRVCRRIPADATIPWLQDRIAEAFREIDLRRLANRIDDHQRAVAEYNDRDLYESN